MAKTTFSGPIRSENNYKLVSKTASTGVVHDRSMGPGVKDARRYYLEEWFNQRPQLNAALADATESTRVVANRDFEVIGTNMTSALATFSTTHGGVLLTTAGADQDQAILLPHTDSAQTAWDDVIWGTENSVEWEASISLPAIDNQWVWAGLKKAEGLELATDTEQAFFTFGTDTDNSGQTLTDFTKWHFVHSIGGTDYISQLPITVAADTPYHLKVVIDSDRKATIYVNGIQYNVTSTSGSTGGTAVTAVQPSKAVVKTAAITNDVPFKPYIGIEANAGAAEALNVHYQSISRVVFE